MSQWQAMLASIVIEAVVAAVLIVRLRWGSAARAASAASLGTLVTHWPAWKIAPALAASLGDVAGFVTLETAVTVVEAGVYLLLATANPRRALTLSLAANACSAAVGIVLYAFNLLAPA